MAFQRSSAWTIERLTGTDSRTVLRPLFEEYLTWLAEQLRDNYGIVFDEPDEVVMERHHRAFDAELPKMLGPRGRVIVARAGDAIVAVGTMKPVTDDIAEIKRVYVRPMPGAKASPARSWLGCSTMRARSDSRWSGLRRWTSCVRPLPCTGRSEPRKPCSSTGLKPRRRGLRASPATCRSGWHLAERSRAFSLRRYRAGEPWRLMGRLQLLRSRRDGRLCVWLESLHGGRAPDRLAPGL